MVSPSPALWKSPKSPNESNETSWISSEKLAERLNGSLREAAAESENGPKLSSFKSVRDWASGREVASLTSSSSAEKGSLNGLSAGGGGKAL